MPRQYSERFKRIMAKRDPKTIAQIALNNPCFDIPTKETCLNCIVGDYCLLKSRKTLITFGNPNELIYRRNMYLAILQQVPFTLTPESIALSQNLQNPRRRLNSRQVRISHKSCLLPDCEATTSHRGSYCCAEHLKEHKRRQRKC